MMLLIEFDQLNSFKQTITTKNIQAVSFIKLLLYTPTHPKQPQDVLEIVCHSK